MARSNEQKEFSNPFEDTNAAHMDDDLIMRYWISPQGFLDNGRIGHIEFVDLIPNIMFGGRGSGKTTILKYLSFEIQKKIFQQKEKKENLQRFLEDCSFLGIYYRFDGPILSSLKGKGVSDETWSVLFSNFIELVLGQLYLNKIIELIENKGIPQIDEGNLCKEICKSIFVTERNDLNTLHKISSEFSRRQLQIENWKDLITYKKDAQLDFEPLGHERILFGIPQICQDQIPELRKIMIFYLLDEYENLEEKQQVIINTLIKQRKGPVSFKISSRINGFKTKETTSKEFLQDGSDYRSLNLEVFASRDRQNYRILLENIATKRLQEHDQLNKIPNLDIKMLLGNSPSPEAEARMIIDGSDVKDKHFHDLKEFVGKKNTEGKNYEQLKEAISCPEKPLVEKLNILLIKRGKNVTEVIEMMKKFNENPSSSPQYENLYDKNKLGLLYQLLHDYPPKQKIYAGFQMYTRLSSGIIRTFIELCYNAFYYAIFNDVESLKSGKTISHAIQTLAVEDKSNKFYDDIYSIPENMGKPIARLVENIGTILRTLHLQERLSEPEQTYFSTDYSLLSEKVSKLLDTAVMWSIFHQYPSMDPSQPNYKHYKDYLLNHILSPKYSISYRKRGRTPIHPSLIEIMCYGTEQEEKEVRNRLSKEGASYLTQKTLSDYLR